MVECGAKDIKRAGHRQSTKEAMGGCRSIVAKNEKRLTARAASRSFYQPKEPFQLSMSAAFEPATGTTEREGASGGATSKRPHGVSAIERGATPESTHKRSAFKPRATSEVPNKGAVSKTADEPVSKAPVEPAEPWPGADEDASREELRSVVTIRRARVRIIPVVAVRADGRRRKVTVARADENAHGNMSRVPRSRNHQNTQDGKILEILHFSTPRSDPRYLPQTQPDLNNLQ